MASALAVAKRRLPLPDRPRMDYTRLREKRTGDVRAMMYCCIYIDYLSQLERTGVREATAFLDEVRSTAAEFGGAVGSRKDPVVVAFPSGGLFDGIQAVEAMHRTVESLTAREPALRGASLAVYEGASADDAVAFSAAARYRDHSAYLKTLSPEAAARLEAYFPDGDGAWRRPLHVGMMADADAVRLFDRPRLAATLSKAIGRSSRHGPRLVHLDAGSSVRSIDAIAADMGLPPERALMLCGARLRPIPFSPLIEAIMARCRDADDEPPRGDDALLRGDDAMAFRFVESSSFSAAAPASVATGCAAFIDSWLDAFGASGGVVACDAPERFSAEARELIASRLESGRGDERYLSISSGGPLERWIGSWAAKVPDGLADADDRPRALSLALGSTEGATRDALAERFGAVSGWDGARRGRPGSGLAGLLELMPKEAFVYLYTIVIAENELSEDELADFVGGLGLGRAGADVLRRLLVQAGLVDPFDPRTPVEPLSADELAGVIGDDVAETLRDGLSRYLVGLYRSGRIRASLGFLRRVGERQDDERLICDCLFEDAMRPDKPAADDPSFLSPSSAAVNRFWTALVARDRDASEAAAASADERLSGPRAQAMKALVKAELAYAQGDAERASKGAREAMLALGKGAPPRLEARSQRLMGLASLALARHTEAADYLTNAQELSESAGIEYERMMAAYAKAVVDFLSGAIGRSLKVLKHAEESSSRLFRMDAKAAVESLRGRIDLELGAYDEAARRFGALAETAAAYGMGEAARRARIWGARALAYAGSYDAAAEALEAELGDGARPDPEAMVFRGELELLRGRPREARAWLAAPDEPPLRAFDPADAFDWSCLLSEIEGRSIGFEAADAPLSQLRTSLELFARGLDERDPACAVQLHELTRSERGAGDNPGMGTYGFFCYLLEERLPSPPVDKQTVLSRSFKLLQQRAGRIEDRAQRALYMEKNIWNRRLLEAARLHKFI